MENILAVAIGAAIGFIGVVFGSWFTVRRQDRRWIREQKLKAGIGFNTAVGPSASLSLRSSGKRSPDRSPHAIPSDLGRASLFVG
ncbi:hypothetical protein ACH41E_02055 [Streptomyces sp. NPDC020412]|uniref:hypothetical protein n=1 Tax=Streptomyces sp. NPDC020412 TaxID=3365073 RepID=UPI0037AB0F17